MEHLEKYLIGGIFFCVMPFGPAILFGKEEEK